MADALAEDKTIEEGGTPSDTNEPLDADAPESDGDSPNQGPTADDEELLKQKNPLGYTVTEPTEEEMDKQA